MLSLLNYSINSNKPTVVRSLKFLLLILFYISSSAYVVAKDIPPFDNGPYAVGSSNVHIAKEFSQLSGQEMDRYLIGDNQNNERHFINEILSEKNNSLLFNVTIPKEQSLYGDYSGLNLPVFIHVTYPTRTDNSREHYDFPYDRITDTRFEHMQRGDEKPIFANDKARYPLVFDSHGMNTHGFWSASTLTKFSSHGYIVATVSYGDARLKIDEKENSTIRAHENIRPIIAKAALNFLLVHPDYMEHIDSTRIAATGHSLGGYTSLVLAGGQYNVEGSVIKNVNVHAVIASAPWVGGKYQGVEYTPFGKKAIGLSHVKVPVLGLYGSKDAPLVRLQAFQQLSGPRYVIELVDQPHVYAQGSWQDQSNWTLLFLNAYLKGNKDARKQLASAISMQGGGIDKQKFDLQRLDIK